MALCRQHASRFDTVNARVEWATVAEDFEPDGSLRDIYVHETSGDDWQRVLEHLKARYSPLRFMIDSEDAPLPSTVGDIFAIHKRAAPSLGFSVDGVLVACHFFTEDEIEFDIAPQDVRGPAQLAAIQAFMIELGRLTSRVVSLTPESMPHLPILEFDPRAETFRYVPPAA
jgi:hypothetical protein